MRELERDLPTHSASAPEPPLPALAIVGAGRVGGSIAAAAAAPGSTCGRRPRRRLDASARGGGGPPLRPRRRDRRAAGGGRRGPSRGSRFVGHTSGATGLDALAPRPRPGRAAFSLHPLQTVPDGDTDLTGAPARSPAPTAGALGLARALAMRSACAPSRSPRSDRAAYHAAAAIASNFLVALEESAVEPARARRGRGRRASSRAARPAHRGELGRARRRTRSPARSPAATRRPSRATSRRCARPPRSCSTSTRRWPSAPGRRGRRRRPPA